jgi:heme A synthase
VACRRLVIMLVIGLFIQVGLGLLTWLDRAHVLLATAHTVVGSLIIGHLVLLAWFLQRDTRLLQVGEPAA